MLKLGLTLIKMYNKGRETQWSHTMGEDAWKTYNQQIISTILKIPINNYGKDEQVNRKNEQKIHAKYDKHENELNLFFNQGNLQLWCIIKISDEWLKWKHLTIEVLVMLWSNKKLSYISGGNANWYIQFGKLGTSTKTEHIVIL